MLKTLSIVFFVFAFNTYARDPIKFCNDKNIKGSTQLAWQMAVCKKHKAQSPKQDASPTVLSEYYDRLIHSRWSGYEFPLSGENIKSLFDLEIEAERNQKIPFPNSIGILANDFKKGSVPRSDAALRFMMTALQYSDASNTESLITALSESFERSPEQFVIILNEVQKKIPNTQKVLLENFEYFYSNQGRSVGPKIKEQLRKIKSNPDFKGVAEFLLQFSSH